MSSVIIAGDTSGSVTLQAPATAGSTVVNLPSTLGNTGTSSFATTDASGNLGLGVTPSAWNSAFKVFEFGSKGNAVYTHTSNYNVNLSSNAYYDASGYKYGNTAAASYYNQYNGIHSWYTAPSGTAGNAISFTQAMTLDSSGNLGVGTSSPTAKLDVSTASGNTIIRAGTTSTTGTTLFQASGDSTQNLTGRTWGTANAGALFGQTLGGWSALYTDGAASNGLIVGTFTAKPLIFGASNIERMRIESGGSVLLGTTTANGTGGVTFANLGTTTPYGLINQTASGTLMFFRYNSTTVGSITQNTTSTTYATSSDYRLKNSIAPMTGALAKVAALNPVTYKWNADGSDGEGFIAHELAEVFPDAVVGEKDAVETYTDEEGNEQTRPVYQGIDTSFLVATLTAAIQEQQALITQLQADVAALKGQ